MSIERDKDFEQLEDIAAMMAENPGIEFENGKYVYYGLDGRTAFAAVYISGAWAGWQAKAQEVPEGKYILQTFSTYSGVCEDKFNHKNIGVFESIDAAMFHARHIGLIMNHYGYEFRVIEAQEPK